MGVVVCKDGFSMSVQASSRHYCTPKNDVGPYNTVEVGMPSAKEALLMPYAEDASSPTSTVYGWVPSNIIWDVITRRGGYVSGELPPLFYGDHHGKEEEV